MKHVKIRKVGNSLGVVLPREVLEQLNLAEGDELILTTGADGALRATPHDPAVAEQIGAGRDLMRRYRDTFRALARNEVD